MKNNFYHMWQIQIIFLLLSVSVQRAVVPKVNILQYVLSSVTKKKKIH